MRHEKGILLAHQYTVYGLELSLFTRKLEAAMDFYGAPFVRKPKTAHNRKEIEYRSGTHQVPVLRTPENWMIADTTPAMMMLDNRYPARGMFPAGPLGVLVHVVEEFLDEWVARVMVHYRWHYKESSSFAAERITRASMPGSDDNAIASAVKNTPITEWGRRACRATGTASKQQQDAAEAEYRRILEAADQQLQKTPYLLGTRPCAVDTIVLGGLRAHTYMDPDPKKTVSGYPRIVEWCKNATGQWKGGGELAPFPDSTPFAQMILAEMPSTYRPYIMGNADAQIKGEKAFIVNIYGEDVSYLSRPYPELSRQMILNRIKSQIDTKDRNRIREWLVAVNLAECLL